jgi:methionine-rich copper-binding protein CopC
VHCNVPPFAADDCYQEIGRRMAANVGPTNVIAVECGNEHWDGAAGFVNFFSHRKWYYLFSYLPPGTKWLGLTADGNPLPVWNANYETTEYTLMSRHAADQFKVGFVAGGGDASKVKAIAGSFFTLSSVTDSIVRAAALTGITFDYVAVADYKMRQMSPTSAPLFETASASCINDFTRYRWRFGPEQGVWGSHHALASAAGMQLCGYEGGEMASVTFIGVPGNAPALQHDLDFHPSARDLAYAVYAAYQVGDQSVEGSGAAFANWFSLYGTMRWDAFVLAMAWGTGNPPGTGDGTDGLRVNQFATSQGGAPADGLDHSQDNVSPLLLGMMDFAAGNVTTPVVTATTPASGATSVASNATIQVNFSLDMNSGSLSLTLTPQGGSPSSVPLTSYHPNLAVFTPSAPLANATTYTAQVNGTSAAGVAMASPYSWSFTTGAGPAPTVTATTPATGATQVAISPTITVTYSQSMQSGTLSLVLTATGQPTVTCTLSGYNSGTDTATFTTPTSLAYATTYTATANGTGTSTAVLTQYQWTFTTVTIPTVTATTPASGATGVDANTTIQVAYSEAMTSGSLTLSLTPQGGSSSSVPLTSYASGLATFTPSAPLSNATTYTAQAIGTSAAGVSMASPYSWSFTTGAGPAPTVTATTPATGATQVAVNPTITVTYSESMQSGTLTVALTASGQPTVNCTLSNYNSGTDTATFTTPTSLAYATLYTATANGTGTSTATLVQYQWTFTTVTVPTVTATTPTSGATGVAVGSTIQVAYSEAMTSGSLTLSLTPQGGSSSSVPLTSYTSGLATFTPSAPLSYATLYTATTNGTSAASTPMASPYTWTFTTGAGPAPTVTTTTPASGTTQVAVSPTIAVVYSASMQSGTLALVLTATGQPTVNCTLSNYNSGTNTATFTVPSSLAYATLYTAAASGTGTSTTALIPYQWTFTTDTIPVVTATTPASGAMQVSANPTITVTYSEAMTSGSLTLALSATGQATVNCTLSGYNSGTKTATFAVPSALTGGTAWAATANGTGTSTVPLTQYRWTFTTVYAAPVVTAVTPANGATQIASTAGLTATFSGAVLGTSVAFTLTPAGGSAAAGTTVFASPTGTFTPSAPLLASTNYTAIVNATAPDSTAMSPFSWSFTTQANQDDVLCFADPDAAILILEPGDTRNPPDLTIVVGSADDFPLQTWNRGSLTTPSFDAGDTIVAYIYQAKVPTPVCSPGVSWYQAGGATAGQVLVEISNANAALLQPTTGTNTYLLVVVWTPAADTTKAMDIVRLPLTVEGNF